MVSAENRPPIILCVPCLFTPIYADGTCPTELLLQKDKTVKQKSAGSEFRRSGGL